MTISVLLMILTFGIGPGTGQSIEDTSTTETTIRQGKIAGNCYINGIWYNPCPTDPTPPPSPDPSPEIQLP